MAIVRCSSCGGEFDLEDNFSRMPEHWLNREQGGPLCNDSYGYGYPVNENDYDPFIETSATFREKLLAKASA